MWREWDGMGQACLAVADMSWAYVRVQIVEQQKKQTSHTKTQEHHPKTLETLQQQTKTHGISQKFSTFSPNTPFYWVDRYIGSWRFPWSFKVILYSWAAGLFIFHDLVI